jgi:hypothetical protein
MDLTPLWLELEPGRKLHRFPSARIYGEGEIVPLGVLRRVANAPPAAESCGMADRIRIIPHYPEGIPDCEVRFADGRPSCYFYWDDIAGRRLRPDLVDGATAKREAQLFARAAQRAGG